MNKQDQSQRLALRILAALLAYPGAPLLAALPELGRALDQLKSTRVLPATRVTELRALVAQFAALDPFELEARFVDTFDRGRSTSLALFEHVHGDSRERGPALVDLLQTYERAGLYLGEGEFPDHLPVVLEFASTQSASIARDFLAEMAHILSGIFSALVKQHSPYACVLAAVLEIAGERPHAVPVAAEPALDEAWAEPPAFDGCSTRGQARPGTPQPLHFVRKPLEQSAQGVFP